MKIAYKKGRLGPERLHLVAIAEAIVKEYQRQGYKLTLRQLYYQFVARDEIPNTVQSYKRLGDIINEARLLGLISWEAIEDRTRNLESLSTWRSPHEIVDACGRSYRMDLWDSQLHRIEVWVEKEALAGVVERAARQWRVPFLSCRGYTSQSEMWGAGQRLQRHIRHGQRVVILHLGDHDPSGIDMSRDIEDRLRMFVDGGGGVLGDYEDSVTFTRIALNYDQVEQYGPPPNPAKTTDARFAAYEREYGTESWELDALPPAVLNELIQDEIQKYINRDTWKGAMRVEDEGKRQLGIVADKWERAVSYLDNDESWEEDSGGEEE